MTKSAVRLFVMDGMSDSELIARALAGDRASQDALVERYYDDCWRYAYRLLGDRTDAEDAVQETFMRAMLALPQYREHQRFRAWLFTILVNQCRNLAIARSRRARRFLALPTNGSTGSLGAVPPPFPSRRRTRRRTGDARPAAPRGSPPPLRRRARLRRHGAPDRGERIGAQDARQAWLRPAARPSRTFRDAMIPPHDATSSPRDPTVGSDAPSPSLARWYRASVARTYASVHSSWSASPARSSGRDDGGDEEPRTHTTAVEAVASIVAAARSTPPRDGRKRTPRQHPPSRSRPSAPGGSRRGRPWRWIGIAATVVVTVGATVYLNALARERSGAPLGSTRRDQRRRRRTTPPAHPSSPLRGAPPSADSLHTHDVGFALRLTDGAVRQVSLAGDFNDWDTSTLPMVRDPADGTWRVRIPLAPGRHTYSFVVDGTRWVIDPLAPRTVEGDLGPANVIAVSGDS